MEQPDRRTPFDIAREIVIIFALSAVVVGFLTLLHVTLPSISA